VSGVSLYFIDMTDGDLYRTSSNTEGLTVNADTCDNVKELDSCKMTGDVSGTGGTVGFTMLFDGYGEWSLQASVSPNDSTQGQVTMQCTGSCPSNPTLVTNTSACTTPYNDGYMLQVAVTLCPSTNTACPVFPYAPSFGITCS
jgi:hypothetical protein